MNYGFIIFITIVVVLAIIIITSTIKIVPQSYAYVVERIGAYNRTCNVGLHILVPFLDRVSNRVSLKEQVMDFPPQPVITKDNVTNQSITDNHCLKLDATYDKAHRILKGNYSKGVVV